jgi:hypothetical protein
MSNDDLENHMAESFPLLVSDLQRGDVLAFEEKQKKEREARAALRAQDTTNQGMTASELLKKIDGDPLDGQRKVELELDRMAKEAQAAVAKKDKQQNEALPAGHFPPPPTSG